MRSKIFLLGPYPPPYGGVSVYVEALNEFLNRSGFDCRLRIYPKTISPEKDSIRPNFISICNNFHRISKNDICLDSSTLFVEYPSVRAIIAWLFIKVLKRFKWTKIIHDGSLPSRYKGFGLIRKYFFHLAVNYVDEFVTANNDLCIWLRTKINPKQRVSLIGSLLPILPAASNSSLPSQIEKSISGYDKLICSIGVFTPTYGFEHIANAVEVIREESGTNIGLLLIDGCFAIDRSYKSKVLKNRKWVVVLENVPHMQVLQILKKSDVFVRGGRFESYGLSRVEALWSGIPVVATKVGETRGMLLYDFGEEEELIQQIKRALLNPLAEEIKVWGDYFSREANENLKAVIRLIDPGRRYVCSAK